MPSDRLPVVEVFGPTIQGEGPDAGKPAHFVRLGGCDYRCSWCDSMFAVDPAQVREAERLTPLELVRRIRALTGARRVVLTGGNPALHDLGGVVKMLRNGGYLVAVETQGSRWQDWLGWIDRLVISPKPPSAGVQNVGHECFMRRLDDHPIRHRAATKIVVFDEADLEWAVEYRGLHPWLPLYLSAGSPVGFDDDDTKAIVSSRFAWLATAVVGRRELADATVLPQLHVVAWGARRGV